MKTTLKNLLYPVSCKGVHSKYGQYIGWSFVSNFCASTEMVLSTHSMLAAVGNSSSEIAVSINYIGKDLVGQVGGIFYMGKMGKVADSDPKRFIKHSMFLQQFSTLMECSTPLWPTWTFIPIASVANIGKNISFMGFGAINASVIQTLAIDNNTGEIYAKVCASNTIASTLGMIAGLAIAATIPDHLTRITIVPVLGVARYVSYNKSIDGLINIAK
jgi:hypothetical protein